MTKFKPGDKVVLFEKTTYMVVIRRFWFFGNYYWVAYSDGYSSYTSKWFPEAILSRYYTDEEKKSVEELLK